MKIISLIKNVLRPIKRSLLDARATKFLKRKKKIKGDKITTVFICQCQHIWDKHRFVVKNLVSDPAFKVILYIVKDPSSNESGQTIFERYAVDNGVEYKFYEDVKLKDLSPYYVIYSRPYENSLPQDLQGKSVIKYANTAYIPYGYSLMELGETNLNTQFIRYLKMLFADMDYAYDYFVDKRKKQVKKGVQLAYNIGYPYLDELRLTIDGYKDKPNAFDNVKNNGLKVMWTPRWTIEDKLGGSNFFRYIDDIFDTLIDKKDYSFVFRPHPYAFDNYVKEGLMTEEKRNEYLSRIKNSDNSFYDHSNEYFATFINSDVLISDISSIIAEYLLTKKPVIFCHNESNEILNDKMKEILGVFYNAYSIEDVKYFIEQIKKGNDTLKEQREKYVDKFIEEQSGSAERILGTLKDFYQKNR